MFSVVPKAPAADEVRRQMESAQEASTFPPAVDVGGVRSCELFPSVGDLDFSSTIQV